MQTHTKQVSDDWTEQIAQAHTQIMVETDQIDAICTRLSNTKHE